MKSKIFIGLTLTLVFLSAVFSSCKDTPFLDYSKTQPIIEFGQSPASGSLHTFGYAGDSAGSVTIDTAVALVVAAPQPLSSAVTANVQVNVSAINSFLSEINDYSDGTFDTVFTYTPLPDSLFKLTTTATIEAGHTIGRLPITLNLSKFSDVHHYALSLAITGAKTANGDSLIVSSNSSNFIWLFDRDTL